MECKKCGIGIDEFELYCNDCKELLKKEKEYEILVLKNKELNKFEITKEVENLQNFKDEAPVDKLSLKEELKDIVNIEDVEFNLNQNNNKKTIIIICSILLVISISILMIVLYNDKDNNVAEEKVINYKKIILDYGKIVSSSVVEYLNINGEIPSWSAISEIIEYKDYDVVCSIHSIYKDGNIYLNGCKVDDEETEYSYGEYQEEIKGGKKVEIFKKSYNNNYFSYSNINDGNLELAGTITCKTESCEYVIAYNKYVLIKESDGHYLYDYETSSIEFGPFEIAEEENNMLAYENDLYGIIYESEKSQNMYNTNTGKTLKNLKGELLVPNSHFNSSIIYKYGYVILKENDKNNFVNLKTGNVSYTITGLINAFIDDVVNNVVYMTTLNPDNSKLTIYNSNGKKKFGGKEYNHIILHNGKIIVADDTNFYVYNSKLIKELTSKDYDILDVYNGFVAVIDSEYLSIVDFDDNILTTFDLKWESKKYSLDTQLSGYVSDTEIKLIISEDNSNKFLECYYNIETLETKVIEFNT